MARAFLTVTLSQKCEVRYSVERFGKGSFLALQNLLGDEVVALEKEFGRNNDGFIVDAAVRIETNEIIINGCTNYGGGGFPIEVRIPKKLAKLVEEK